MIEQSPCCGCKSMTREGCFETLTCDAYRKRFEKPDTDPCRFCDEFWQDSERYPGKGYCTQYDTPTSPELLERCREEIRVEWGEFCWNECPFVEEDGPECEEPGVPDITACPVFLDRLNLALGGVDEWEYEYYRDHGFAYYPGAPIP